ncbi:MAG: MFS transporter [Candidatus Anammoxibacter sp.]
MKVILKTLSESGIINGLKNSSIFRFFICNLLYSANLWLSAAYYPVYFNKIGLSDNRIGILISAISFVTMIFVLPFGVMSDRFMPKTLLRLGAFLMAASNILIILFNSFYYIFAIVAITGIGSTLFVISLYTMYYKQLGEDRRGIRIALFTLGTALGFGVGPFAGGFIISYMQMKWVFIFGALLNLALFFLVSVLKTTNPIKFRIEMYKKDILRPEVLFLIVIVFIMSSHIGVERTCLTLVMSKVIGLTGIQMGTIFLVVGVWVSVVCMFAGYLFDKTKRLISLIALSILVTGFFQALTAYADSFFLLLIIRIFHTIGDSFFLVLKVVLITMIFPNSRMGGNFGFVYSINTAAAAVAALLSGVLSNYYGYGFPFIANGLLLVTIGIILLAMKGRIERIFSRHQVNVVKI